MEIPRSEEVTFNISHIFNLCYVWHGRIHLHTCRTLAIINRAYYFFKSLILMKLFLKNEKSISFEEGGYNSREVNDDERTVFKKIVRCERILADVPCFQSGSYVHKHSNDCVPSKLDSLK